MGTVFRYIADAALETEETECMRCGTTERPRYHYYGKVADDPNDQFEYALCADCLNSGAAAKERFVIEPIRAVAGKFVNDPERLVDAYQRLPAAFPENGQADWPICCNDWCEYTGHPADRDEARDVPKSYQEWNNGPYGTEFNAVYELLPENVTEVSLFECLSCDRKYHMHNPT